MTLLQPSYLWGLLALAIPIAIHLWSRKKVRTIKVGSTQFIVETKSKQSNSIQLNEWWLLALRCLIISTLVFILTEPHISKTPEQQNVAYVFEPSLLATEEGRARFVQIPTANRRLLKSGFPEWKRDEDLIASDEVPNYWQLARNMEDISADSIVVFVRAFAKAVKGKRPELNANVNWITVDLEHTVLEPLVGITKKDSVAVLSVQSNGARLAFEKKSISNTKLSFNATKDSVDINTENAANTVAILNQKSTIVTIVYDTTTDAQRIYMEAAFRAIGTYIDREIQLNTLTTVANAALEKSDYLVILNNTSIPSIDIPTLVYRPDPLERTLIAAGDTLGISYLTKKLTPQIVIEEHFVEQVLEWLQLDQEIEAKIDPWDVRTISSNQLQTNVSSETINIKKSVMADLSDTLWMVLLVLLVGERLLARIRKQ
jgi:hypothetical protein